MLCQAIREQKRGLAEQWRRQEFWANLEQLIHASGESNWKVFPYEAGNSWESVQCATQVCISGVMKDHLSLSLQRPLPPVWQPLPSSQPPSPVPVVGRGPASTVPSSTPPT